MSRRRTFTQTRRARSTGATITVCESDEGEVDEGLPWMTVCDDHGSCVCHTTLAIARAWAAEPEMWCEDCQAIKADKDGKTREPVEAVTSAERPAP